MVDCWVRSVREKTAKIPTLYIFSWSPSLPLNLVAAVGRWERCPLRLASRACVAPKWKKNFSVSVTPASAVMLVGGGVLQRRQEGDQKIAWIFGFGLCRGVLTLPGDASPPVYFLGLRWGSKQWMIWPDGGCWLGLKEILEELSYLEGGESCLVRVPTPQEASASPVL